MSREIRYTRYHQCGAALVVSLLFLLIMTVVGITALQVASLEEKMSGNLRARNLAFQAAESALRAGEIVLRQTMDSAQPPAFDCANGLFPMNDADCDGNPDLSSLWQMLDWDPASGQVVSYNYPKENVAAYSIEVIGCIPNSSSLETGKPCSTGIDPCFYRLTVRGTGGIAGAAVVLQSAYTHVAVDHNTTLVKGVCNG